MILKAARMAARTKATVIRMTDAGLLRLLSWTSAAFPTGGFAYSAGLESAVWRKLVADEATLETWLQTSLFHGSAWNDAIFVSLAVHESGDESELDRLDALCAALANGASRWRETIDQGKSFVAAAAPWFDAALKPRCFPVAFGAACGASGIGDHDATSTFLQSLVTAQLQCAIRLSVIGQNAAARLLHDLEPLIRQASELACKAGEDKLGGCSYMADIAALDHEHLRARLFLS